MNLTKSFSHFLNLLSGVAIGAGWQSTVAYVNLACYYLIGIPVGLVLGYVLSMQVQVSFFFSSSYLVLTYILINQIKH